MAILDIPQAPEADLTQQQFGDASPVEEIKEVYSDMETPTGLPDYSEYIAPDTAITGDAGTYQPGKTYATPETMVSNQLTSLLESTSPYMQLAKSKALSQANRMGLLSSSMATGAGHRAAIEAALPIAQQDARTYTDFMKQQQQLEGQGELARSGTVSQAELIGVEGDVSAGLASHKASLEQANVNMNNAFTAALTTANKQADTLTQGYLQDVQGNWNHFTQVQLTDLQSQWKDRFNAQQMSQSRYEIAMNAASQITQNVTTNITEMMQDPDIMSGDPQSVANMFNNMLSLAMSSIELVGEVGTIPADELDALLYGFDDTLGFEGKTEFTTATVPTQGEEIVETPEA